MLKGSNFGLSGFFISEPKYTEGCAKVLRALWSPVEPALHDLVHARAHLVVLISEVARSFEPADDGPIARTDLAAVALAIAVDEVTPTLPCQLMISAETASNGR